MKELEKQGEAFEADLIQDNLKDIIGDLSEQTLESLGENLPGLSIFFKASKAINSVKDYYFMQKVATFLTEISKMPMKKRKNLIEKINKDKIYGQRFGSFLLVAIERHDFAEKSIYLARACKFYERGDISKSNLILLNTMLENLHLIEIKRWMTRDDKKYPTSQQHGSGYHNFFANGVIRMDYDFNKVDKEKRFAKDGNDLNQVLIKTRLTNLGIMLYHIVQDKPLNKTQRTLLDLGGRADTTDPKLYN